MRGLFPLLLGVALSLTTVPEPARAADIATLTCVTDTASKEARADAAQYVHAMFDKGPSERSPGLLVKITGVAKDCAKRHGWSDAAGKMAAAYALATIGIPIGAEELRKRGVNPDRISELFDQLPQAVRDAGPNGDMPPEFATVMQQGLDDGSFRDEDLPSIMPFIALLFMRDYARAEFLRA